MCRAQLLSLVGQEIDAVVNGISGEKMAWDMYEILRERRFKLQSTYSNWVHEILNNVWNEKLWNGFQVTFMFNHIPGTFERKCEVMEDELDRVYRTLVPQVERFPRSA